ncbi:aminomethyl-transferring glycine dehydrogenase subunit GcvPB [Roseateles oligotrophus]|uniref:glycine dehydrogenase (aminomethyl-transferring) n=1 Tax=Roseateles oligotrophus TaxID=1769250 RepID=A0ABT2YI67_9BURK|nr:aminomethyl-transferring glycine dehydrogenase subunit GcvPB [Roseateles oligotrophus]MCV2369625.1 aminomethyl-transferring glycine dehydrogenase subunit GcvPB [Roseateles oligotrophus]
MNPVNMENISAHRFTDGKPNLRRYQQARWDEPVIFELSQPGERALLTPELEPAIEAAAHDVLFTLPPGMRRKLAPALPELSQNRVLRHYLRLSQETLGADFNVDVGQGTCTMKYNPKVNEHLARDARMSELHPLQDESTVQGILHVMHEMEGVLKEVSGMDAVSLQPRSGSQAIYANLAMIRAWFEARGEAGERDEIITTIFSHPSDAACAKVLGYKVITLYPDAEGYPDLAAMQAAVGPRTAALIITNPEDTGIFNAKIREFVAAAHGVGALACYDQANANGLLGITRAREAGFDLSHFNLHKTFSTPHACGGPAVGACAVTAALAPFLPRPVIVKEPDGRYRIEQGGERSIGKVAAFMGTASIVLRAYAWVMNLGAAGLREVAEIAVLNNNYMMAQLLKIRGLSAPYAPGKRRIEQVRYSWAELCAETGVHSGDIGLRAADYGVHYWTSHHPYVVPEPATIEPTESYSRADLDEFAQIMSRVADEARADPEMLRSAPHNCPTRRIDESCLDDPKRWAITWRGWQRKLAEHGVATPTAMDRAF